MYQLVLLRHGESTWNLENRFTGWADVDVTPKGVEQARQAGLWLKAAGFEFDRAETSVLKRAVWTTWHCLDAMDRVWLPVNKQWRLNERHYGTLQGLDKAETAELHGAEQVRLWRRSYDIAPPPLEASDPRWQAHDPRYAKLAPGEVPLGECLRDTVARVLPLWDSDLAPAIRRGERLLISAHGNSLRALIMHLDRMTPEEILQVSVPNAVPLVYELDANLQPTDRYFLREERTPGLILS
ncbi:MAG TPA: 2,3-diphosphoglycerate-dependent phosphoglycerate mutase [Methylibium sp.]|nr:2,3-diphosphoglycerate-dependent phosphoglycerate mutase [Methylibium sp.]